MSTSDLLNNSDLFIEKSLQFQTENINVELIPIPIQDAKFGILKLNANSAPMNQEVHEFIFMVDRSGSMSDMCSDGRDKMQHIIHTLKNMIIYFKDNKSAKVFINVYTFDDKIEEIVERTHIDEENFDSIIAKINRINPRNSTNIEKALISIKTSIDNIQLKNPTHNICNIFMTDGEATAGNCNFDYLSGLVDRTITNAFIGFGVEHDAVLLNSVANGDNSSYYFIDKLENSGIVYGEILHGILYKVLSNVTIECSNCLIYDYKNNLWCDSLKVEDIVSESNKVYHFVSTKPNECRILLKAKANKGNNTTKYGFFIFNKDEPLDLSKYVFRQRTLQLLYKINQFIQKKNSTKRNFGVFRGFDNIDDNSSIVHEQNSLKKEMKNFMDEMKKFMNDNNLNDDGIMKNLCDDVYISYRTFTTKFGAMYNCARQTSQGTQRCYAVNHTPDEIERENPRAFRRPILQRQTNALPDCGLTPTINLWNSNSTSIPFPDLTDDHEEDMTHVLSNFEDSPYLTPCATQVMREISCGTTCDIFAQSKNYISDDDNDELDEAN